jgi:hypothetical protein
MRDRLIALGLRRPMRVKDEDFDVPMLTEDDFEIAPLPEYITVVPGECTQARDVDAQRKLAQMCIAQSKLCLCISHVLTTQYSVLGKYNKMQGREASTRFSVMVFPKKLDQTAEVRECDMELSRWMTELPASCRYSSELGIGSSAQSISVNRSVLNMTYFATLSALYRPHVLPSASSTKPDRGHDLHGISQRKVREASLEITRISQDLHALDVEKYLPATGVTALLPAITIHLLHAKSCNYDTREAAIDGLCQCRVVLETLRDIYSSADFAIQFLEASIRKAGIDSMMQSARDRFRHKETKVALRNNKLNEICMHSQATQWTPFLTDGHGVDTDFHASSEMDIHIPARQPAANHCTISARTRDSEHAYPHNPLSKIGLELAAANGTEDIGLNNDLDFDTPKEKWDSPLEDGFESGSFMGDMNWVDQELSWSWGCYD